MKTKNRSSLIPLVLAALLVGCTGTPTLQSGPHAETDEFGLVKVDNARVDVAFARPGADYAKYDKIMVAELDLSHTTVEQPSYQRTPHWRKWELEDADIATIKKAYRDAMTGAFEDNASLVMTDTAGPGVIGLRAHLLKISPNAPKDDGTARGGREVVYTDGAGAMTIGFELYDTETGEMLVVVTDEDDAEGMWGRNDRVSNIADMRRIFRGWSRRLRDRFDEVSGR